MRWFQLGHIGSGSFGAVHGRIDVDTGKLLAVKVLNLKRPEGPYMGKEWNLASYLAKKRECEALSHINHPHIVDYIASKGWEGPCPIPEIFMAHKDRNFISLIYGGGSVLPIEDLAHDVFFQMLQALDCLAANNSIHRNVKPENILCTQLPDGRYHFELGDFGICNNAANAVTPFGSPLFQAPEVGKHEPVELQTHKVDVWSLFVTMLWTLNINGFRTIHEQNLIWDPRQAVLGAAPGLPQLWEMSIVEPLERASAAQMLIKCFNGKGLVSDPASIPSITQERMEFMIQTSPPMPPSRTFAQAMTRPMRPFPQSPPQPNGGRTKGSRQIEPFRVDRIN
ncbi:uncharacterized protein N7483_007514 [Penicillium malachiteum]|uniref:uncharacterized protein n=1 Tax=Penicillium malachiteum TaxID=1324776 RepID=UPI0025484894|nr:uncharacterized protein N7483_007514 [Penicillium malachiteum]KAJ5726157.1 hypothetical protein N7483_007514 [Penicillium malachiteum]